LEVAIVNRLRARMISATVMATLFSLLASGVALAGVGTGPWPK